jgi:hypothetical protein
LIIFLIYNETRKLKKTKKRIKYSRNVNKTKETNYGNIVPNNIINLWKYLVSKEGHIRKNIIIKLILGVKGNLYMGIF